MRNHPTDYPVILWDFDGVILDSMEVRDLGFEIVLKDYPTDQVDQLMKYHRSNGGLSRYVKFRYFFETIRGEKITDEQVNELAQEFSEVMLRELPKEEHIIPQTLAFIQEQHQKRKEQRIVSGSDQTELRILCTKLGLTPYFKSIHGSPKPKSELVANILKNPSRSAIDCCLIGDSHNDFDAAIANGISFFGFNNEKLKGLLDAKYIKSFE
jgi:phosphoglycolate phosphatase-like HAD superfamily hydrolase